MFNKNSTVVDNNLSRKKLNELKLSLKKNSFANLILEVCNKYKNNIYNKYEISNMIKDINFIIKNDNTIISKRARNVWQYEMYRINWKTKEQILKTLYNIVLRLY